MLLPKSTAVFLGWGRLAQVCELKWKGKKLTIIKPTTYMNLSGKAVKYWMEKESVALEQLLVIVDDIALPLSRYGFDLRVASAES